MDQKIDFVLTWVDGADEKWIARKKNYMKNYDLKMNSESRYRDWEILKYWFRSVEKYAPWVNKIYFVTEGHVPSWLNTKHTKIQVVSHSDFIPMKYLPTFNSNAIELNFSRLSNLSENFVSFNDDMFLNAPVTPNDFFRGDLPRDIGVFSPIIPIENTIDSVLLNNVELINKHFCKKDILKKYTFKFFNPAYRNHLIKNVLTLPWKDIIGFYDDHIPISYNKSIFSKVLDIEAKIVSKTCSHKFRTRDDISHWLVRYWQICSGNFSARSSNFGKYYNVNESFELIKKDLAKNIHKVICINDNENVEDFETLKILLNKEFQKKYYEKSSYEN